MQSSTNITLLLSTLFLWVTDVQSFSFIGRASNIHSCFVPAPSIRTSSQSTNIYPNNLITLCSSQAAGDEQESVEEVSAETEAVEDEEEEQESIEEVDPEVKALKDEIAELESTLKQKNRDLNQSERMADEYTQSGYARKVAEMEELRKRRKASNVDSKSTAEASVVQEFLPVLDRLQSLNEEYTNDEFAKKYSALAWDFNNALKELGMEQFAICEGDVIDKRRMEVVEEEYSAAIVKGSVIKPITMGYELKGNVIRLAQVVGSLGVEEEESASEESEG